MQANENEPVRIPINTLICGIISVWFALICKISPPMSNKISSETPSWGPMALACSATCNHCLWRMLESSIQNVVHMLPMFHPYSGSSPRKMTKKGTPNSHGVSMCIDCFSVFPYQTGAKIAINCMGKNVHVFPHILRRGSPPDLQVQP